MSCGGESEKGERFEVDAFVWKDRVKRFRVLPHFLLHFADLLATVDVERQQLPYLSPLSISDLIIG